MRWQKAKRSDNVVDARKRPNSRRVSGGLSLAGVVVIVVLGLLSGQDPLHILGNIAGEALKPASVQVSEQSPPTADAQSDFVRAILGDTEQTWQQLFHSAGQQYREPKLVLFSGSINSACGFASSAVGPFYCPADQRVYLDMAFFKEMEERFAAAGDFAQAYVIGHEVGHHVQTLLGVSSRINAARQRGERMEGANGLLVRQELQADCLAGVWAHHGQKRHNWLEPGDLEQALNAASSIGDDNLQRQAQGQVRPDAFTHGTSAQRVRWFRLGFATGQPGRCDTFSTSTL